MIKIHTFVMSSKVETSHSGCVARVISTAVEKFSIKRVKAKLV